MHQEERKRERFNGWDESCKAGRLVNFEMQSLILNKLGLKIFTSTCGIFNKTKNIFNNFAPFYHLLQIENARMLGKKTQVMSIDGE